ncbi:hypothetical protein Trco_004016 [Trichoderma cornu-damae]|uniref:Extracellular mutant protein 11 C-terminal domain-containing protein n=1 Tax=Trichoderma cornu-damae TaxID=654480 RepID=A0A9P8TWQ3_9HYPO|nr:hypothetical protein Trco_004016 [Trichoderma cornu-damae]
MPASLKERSSRLQMFARLKSENEAKPAANTNMATNTNTNTNTNANANANANINANINAAPLLSREPERYQSSAPVLTSSAERRELADSARVPVPGGNNARQPTIHQRRFSQPPPESAQRSHSQSTASRHIDIFTGSQLGDSFLNSGLTSPQFAPSEAEPEPMPEKKNTVVATIAAATTRAAPRYNLDRRFLPSDGAAFQIGEDLLMKVVPGARHHNPSYLNGGFNRVAVGGYSRPAANYRTTHARPEPSPEKQPQPAMREVKVLRHVPRARQIEYDGRGKRNTSPAFGARGRPMRDGDEDIRPMARFQELTGVEEEEEEEEEEEGGELGRRGEAADGGANGDQDDGASTVGGGREDAHATPRVRRYLLSPQRAAFESAVATTMPPFRPPLPKDKKRRRGSLDYDDMALSNMSYTELQREPFDFDPSKATTHIGLGGSAGTLGAKLEQYQHQSEKEQRFMFRSMTVDDWEEAGDWFADQFAEIMHKLREARRNKRRTMQEFEHEAASREEAVRQRTEAIDRKLTKMKQDGQRVVTPNEGLVRQKTTSEAVQVELVGRVVSVHKLDDLLSGHAGVGVAPRQSKVLLLFQAPAVDVLDILRVDVEEGAKHVGHLVVLCELVVYGQEVLEAVLAKGPAGCCVLRRDGLGGDGAEADAPALEDDGLERSGPMMMVDGFPRGGREAIASAGEEGLVVLGESGWGVV